LFIKGEDVFMYKDSGNGNPAISGGQGLDTIISVFFRYSELSAVKYDVEKDIIKLEIALNDNINPNQRSQFINKSRKSMELFYKIYKLNPIHFELDFVEHSGITILRLFRDCKTIIESEMELFMKME
jgi:hypothetical protein